MRPAGPNGDYIYVANSDDDTVSRINIATGAEDRTYDVGYVPNGVAVTPNNLYLFVTNNYSDDVSMIDLTAPVVPTGNGPLGVAAGPNSQYVWIANNAGNSVSKIKVSDNTVEATIMVGNAPYGWPCPRTASTFSWPIRGRYPFPDQHRHQPGGWIHTCGRRPPGGGHHPGWKVHHRGQLRGQHRYQGQRGHGMGHHGHPGGFPTGGPGPLHYAQSRSGGTEDEGGEEEVDTRPPGGPAHQIGGGGNNMDPPIPPNYTWTGDRENGTLQGLTLPLVHTGVNGDGASVTAEAMDIQVPGLMFTQTCPTGETQECWLALGEAGTTSTGVQYTTSMRWNYDVRVIDVQMNWPQSLLRNMASGKHCLTYYLMTEDGRKSNCRVGYLDCSPDTGTASVTVDRDSGTKAPQAVEELAFKLQLSYFNEDTGLVDRISSGSCTVTTESGTWGTFPITDGLLTFTIPFGVTSEIGFNSVTFNGTKTVRIEFKDGFMYAYDQDHRDATVEVYQCVDGESYALEYYQDLVYICNQGADPDGPILGRMYGK